MNRLAADGLEAALGVGEAGEEQGFDHEVVAARDHLSLQGAGGLGGGRQAAAGGDVVTLAGDGLDEGWEGLQLGGEVYVHVADDIGRSAQPGRLEGASAPLLGDVERGHIGVLLGQLLGDG